MIETHIHTTKAEMEPLYPLIQQLSPWVTQERYCLMLDDMLARGYRMIALYEEGACIALSGIWTGTKIYSGSYMELDNVIVDSSRRGAGLGTLLCKAAEELALQEGVEMLMLDAYRENTPAHHFYEKHGFIKRGFHFLKPISGWPLQHPPTLPDSLKD